MSRIRDDLIRLSGILEGEGCFIINKNCPRIQVNMTDEDVIKWIADFAKVKYRKLNGKHYKANPTLKSCYNVTINGEKAISIMLSVYSLMGQRRKAKIKEVIATWKKAPTHPKKKINSRIKEFLKEDYKNGLSYNSLVAKYNLCYASVWNVINGRAWST